MSQGRSHLQLIAFRMRSDLGAECKQTRLVEQRVGFDIDQSYFVGTAGVGMNCWNKELLPHMNLAEPKD